MDYHHLPPVQEKPVFDINNILADIETKGRAHAGKLANNSQALGKSALTTVEIGVRAGKDLASGKLDLTGAEHVAQRGFQQLRKLAEAEGNLAASALVDFLEDAFGAIYKMIPFLPKP